jgi:arsenite methyltransferase
MTQFEQAVMPAGVDRDVLRAEVQSKYAEVALDPASGFHFHTGRPLAEMLGYDLSEVDRLPSGTIESFAGTGNPLGMGALRPGERVLDIGCGAGMDTLLAALQVGPTGQVIAVDMTEAMLAKTSAGAVALGLSQVDTRRGYAESLPIEDAAVDVVLSNGVINLCPDKVAVMREIARVLRPGGRIQIADMVVQRPISQDARSDIDLWAG